MDHVIIVKDTLDSNDRDYWCCRWACEGGMLCYSYRYNSKGSEYGETLWMINLLVVTYYMIDKRRLSTCHLTENKPCMESIYDCA